MKKAKDIRQIVAKSRGLLRRTELGQRKRLARLLHPLPAKAVPGSAIALKAMRELMDFDPFDGIGLDQAVSDNASKLTNTGLQKTALHAGKQYKPGNPPAKAGRSISKAITSSDRASAKKRAQDESPLKPNQKKQQTYAEPDTAKDEARQSKALPQAQSIKTGKKALNPQTKPRVKKQSVDAIATDANAKKKPSVETGKPRTNKKPDKTPSHKTLAQRRKARIIARHKKKTGSTVDQHQASSVGIKKEALRESRSTQKTSTIVATKMTTPVDTSTTSESTTTQTGENAFDGQTATKDPITMPPPQHPSQPVQMASNLPAMAEQPRPDVIPTPAVPETRHEQTDLARLLAEAAYLHGIDRT